MKQLLVFKFEGMALLTRLVLLISASPVLWLVDVFNFSIDVAKTVNKKRIVVKTVIAIVAILAIIHLVENACGELNELYFELLKTTWLSLKIFGPSAAVGCSLFVVGVAFYTLVNILKEAILFKTQAIKISSGNLLPDEIFSSYFSFFNSNHY